MKRFHKLHTKYTVEMLGEIPFWLREEDKRPAATQLRDGYAFASGWRAYSGFEFNPIDRSLKYSDYPILEPLAYTTLHDEEEVIMYPYAWVAIRNLQTGNVEVCRMD